MKSARNFLALAFALFLCFANAEPQTWCIAKPSADNEKLSQNMEYSCQQNGVDCKPIQPGGACFRPNTLVSHASYAMNLYYKSAGKHPWDCHFSATGMIVSQNPSFGECDYPL